MSSRFSPLGPSIFFACTLLTACPQSRSNTEPVAPIAPDPTASADQASDAACTDWSTIDPATLPALPESPYRETFEVVWNTIRTKHYDRTLSCKDWPALRERYGAELATATDEATAFAIMNRLLGELEQSHMALVPASAATRGEVREGERSGSAVVPIEARLLGDDLVVTNTKAWGIAAKLPAGATLLRIDDIDVPERIASIRDAHPERPLAAAFHVARAASVWLSCPAGASKSITYRAHGAAREQTRKERCHEPAVERISMGNIKDFPALFESKMLPNKIGYIHFNIWLLPLAPRIQEAVHALTEEGMQGLVLDLRGNPGGIGAMVVPVARVLLPEAANLGEMRMRDMVQRFAVLDVDRPFSGPVHVLVDERTASTSEIFAVALQELERIKVFGATPSQGAALPSLIEELPGGAKLQFVVASYETSGGRTVEGIGVVPDVIVPESAAAFAKKHDPVLEAALDAFPSP